MVSERNIFGKKKLEIEKQIHIMLRIMKKVDSKKNANFPKKVIGFEISNYPRTSWLEFLIPKHSRPGNGVILKKMSTFLFLLRS